ncbi:DUF6207 family protein [Streptomyces rimosus]
MAAVEVAVGDGETAAAAQVLCSLWWSSGPSRPWRVSGESVVRVRAYVDTRRAPDGSSLAWPWPLRCRGVVCPTLRPGRLRTGGGEALMLGWARGGRRGWPGAAGGRPGLRRAWLPGTGGAVRSVVLPVRRRVGPALAGVQRARSAGVRACLRDARRGAE